MNNVITNKGQKRLKEILDKFNSNNTRKLVLLGCGTSLGIRWTKEQTAYTLYPDLSLYRYCGVEIDEATAIRALGENISPVLITPQEKEWIDSYIRIKNLEEDLYSQKHTLNVSETELSLRNFVFLRKKIADQIQESWDARYDFFLR